MINFPPEGRLSSQVVSFATPSGTVFGNVCRWETQNFASLHNKQIEHQGFISSDSRYFITIALVACQQDVDQVGHVADRDSAVTVDIGTGVAVGSACQQQVNQVSNITYAQAAITVHVTRHNVHVHLNHVGKLVPVVGQLVILGSTDGNIEGGIVIDVSVKAGWIAHRRGDVALGGYRLDSIAASEGILTQRGDAHAQGETLDARATVEGIVAHTGQGLGQHNVGQTRAAGKHVVTDNGVVKLHVGQARAVLEHILPDTRQGCRQLHTLDAPAIVEGIIAQQCQAIAQR